MRLVSYIGKRNQYLYIDGFDSNIIEFLRGMPEYFKLGTFLFLSGQTNLALT